MKKHLCITIFWILLFATKDMFAQFPVIKMPQPATLTPVGRLGGMHNRQEHLQINVNQQAQDMYERDKMEVDRRRIESQRILHEAYCISNRTIQYELPSAAKASGTKYYHTAMNKLISMLNGTIPANLKEAVFSVENAYFEERLEKLKYDKAIQGLITIAHQKTIEDGNNWNNPVTKSVMLFRVMSDTLKIKSPFQEKHITSYPMQYDFEDFKGDKDWSKMFVSKLLATQNGQCHSLPLLYLILCEEIGAEAYLTYSPSHSYIKFKDKSGNWYNLELTNGRIVTDAFIIGSGFITAEAIRNKTYLEPQTKKQVIAQCLSDLAMGYINKYGYDGFVDQCTDSVLKYDAKNLSGLIIKANYETVHFEYVVNQVGRPHPDTLKTRYPQIYDLLNQRNQSYRKIDNSGYREMPKEIYEHWLNSINEEKERREHNEKYNKVVRFSK